MRFLNLAVLFILATAFQSVQAQQPSIPQDAFFVTKISGSSLQSKMSLEDMNKLPVFQAMFKEGFDKSGISSFQEMGVDFSRDAYVFAEQTDSISYLYWSIPLNDLYKFKTVFLSEMRVPKQAAPPYTDGEVTIYWNEKAAVFLLAMVNEQYADTHAERLREQYKLSMGQEGQEDFYGYEEDVVIEVPDAVIEYEEEYIAEDAARDAAEGAVDAAEGAVDSARDAAERAVEDAAEVYEEVEVEDYEIIEEMPSVVDEYSSGYEVEEYEPAYDPYADSYGYGYNEGLDWEERRNLGMNWQVDRMNKLMATAGSGPLISGSKHRHVSNSKSDASAYFDYGAYIKLMMGDFMPGYYGGGMDMMYASMFTNMLNSTHGTNMTSDLNFNSDEVLWHIDYNATGKAAELQEGLFDTKLNKRYLKYMNSDDLIGYYSMNFNTEALLNSYTKLASYYMGGAIGDAEIGELSADILALTLDEEAIAELIPGSMVITFSDISKRMVEYTSYDYDENWNRTEVLKTKEEVLPTFLAMMETHKPKLVERILRLAAKEEREMVETDFGFTLNGGPFPIYFQFNGDMLFIGNDMATVKSIKSGSFKSGLSSEHKKALKAHNSVMYFDAKELIDDLELEYTDGELAEILGFVHGKAESMMITSGMKNKNTTYVDAVVKVPEGEVNGWTYMMNLINSMYEFDTQH